MTSLARSYARLVRQRLSAHPSVALVGSRQVGKTTLAKTLGGAYFDLEQEHERLRLDLEWAGLVRGKRRIILDEAQSWPDIFHRLRGAIDARPRQHNRFLLLGSVSPALMKHVSESLAGRLSIIELTPFLLTELRPSSLDALWLRGGYPAGGILAPSRFPQWQLDYLRLLVERDLPSWGLSARPQATSRFLRMLAAVHGQLWNASKIGESLGLSYHTVNAYLDFLEGTFLVRRLLPFENNLKKRLVKSPRIYLRDSGLLHALLQVPSRDALLSQPWVGASWEGFVIEQILGVLASLGRTVSPHFFRTSDGKELDLVLALPEETWAIEIKLTAQPSPADFKRLDEAADLIGAARRFLISRTTQNVGDRRVSCSLSWFLDRLQLG